MLVGELGVNHGVELNESLLEHSARCIASTDERLGRKTDIQVLHGNGLSVAVEPGCGWVCVRRVLNSWCCCCGNVQQQRFRRLKRDE